MKRGLFYCREYLLLFATFVLITIFGSWLVKIGGHDEKNRDTMCIYARFRGLQ